MTSPSAAEDALLIPYVTEPEARSLAAEELRRLLVLVETLDEGDWHKPTACTAWNVRDMLAHQAGAYASGAGYRELIHQYTAVLKPGALAEDAINERQLADRAGRSPAELVAELSQAADAAIDNWAHGFRLLKPFGMPHPVAGWLSVRHLMLVVHSRDTWIHRLDICRATGRPFEQTQEHDGRINALVVRDLAGSLSRQLGQQAIILELEGVAGGRWRIGRGEPAATIRMDTLDFNIYASGRFPYQEAALRAAFSGDTNWRQWHFGASRCCIERDSRRDGERRASPPVERQRVRFGLVPNLFVSCTLCYTAPASGTRMIRWADDLSAFGNSPAGRVGWRESAHNYSRRDCHE
jgi:uncharacterized protein (TIGR03083 family)